MFSLTNSAIHRQNIDGIVTTYNDDVVIDINDPSPNEWAEVPMTGTHLPNCPMHATIIWTELRTTSCV